MRTKPDLDLNHICMAGMLAVVIPSSLWLTETKPPKGNELHMTSGNICNTAGVQVCASFVHGMKECVCIFFGTAYFNDEHMSLEHN